MITLLLVAPASAAPLDTAGCDALTNLAEVSFTFNVARDGQVQGSRAWTWKPATEQVTRTVGDQTLTFTRGQPVDDEQTQADAQFVNDWFWLMPQCHVSWGGADVALSEPVDAPHPMGEGQVTKVTATYAAGGGGYSPGDAYDLFLGDDGRLVAWHFRKGNQPEPSMTTSFTDYVRIGRVAVAREHVSPDGAFRLFFTDVQGVPGTTSND